MSDSGRPPSTDPTVLSAQPSVLVLVRHGETAGNRDGRYQTYDTPLSDVGRAQAARLADRLLGEGAVRALYTSDLARTMETASIIGTRLNLRPIPAPALRELDVGDWKGHAHVGIEERHPGGLTAWITAGGNERLPGDAGECLDDVAARAIPFVEAVARRHPGERVVLVSHGITLAVVLAHMRGWDRTEALAARRSLVRNTAVSIVEIDGNGGRHCPLLGCTAHLEGMA